MLHHRVLGKSQGTSRMVHHIAAAATRSTLKLPSKSLPLSRRILPVNHAQQRHRFFHHTPSRRLFESTESIISTCLSLVAGAALFKLLSKTRIRVHVRGIPRSLGLASVFPPGSWIKTADPSTVESVSVSLSAGFNLARTSPKHRRQAALREATFRVPYELARLNKDAKDFRIENLGPSPPTPKSMASNLAMNFPQRTDNLDPLDTSVFLYFPNGATKATAAFLAVNDDLSSAESAGSEPGKLIDPDKNNFLLNQSIMFWMAQYRHWEAHQPDLIERLDSESELFPVIFVFRDKVSGCQWHTREGGFKAHQTLGMVFELLKTGGTGRPEGTS